MLKDIKESDDCFEENLEAYQSEYVGCFDDNGNIIAGEKEYKNYLSQPHYNEVAEETVHFHGHHYTRCYFTLKQGESIKYILEETRERAESHWGILMARNADSFYVCAYISPTGGLYIGLQ